jgi:arylsulfatase
LIGNKPIFAYNFLGLSQYTIASPQEIPAGPTTITLTFDYDGDGIEGAEGMGRGGMALVSVNA